MNQTGVCGTGSRLHAFMKAESYVCRLLARGAVVGAHAPNLRTYAGSGRPGPGVPPCAEPPFRLLFPAWLRLRDSFPIILIIPTASMRRTARRGTASLARSRSAVDALRAARLRREIEVDATRPPQRLAPHAYALEAAVVDGEEDLADGRLVLLHDPAGHDAWQGTFRLVTLVRAELEPEMAADPLLPEVCWSWLTGALEARGLSYGEAERHRHPCGFSLLRWTLRPASGDADRDPGVLDTARGSRRGAGLGGTPGCLVRSALPGRGAAAVAGRSGGRRHGRGVASAAAGPAAPLTQQTRSARRHCHRALFVRPGERSPVRSRTFKPPVRS